MSRATIKSTPHVVLVAGLALGCGKPATVSEQGPALPLTANPGAPSASGKAKSPGTAPSSSAVRFELIEYPPESLAKECPANGSCLRTWSAARDPGRWCTNRRHELGETSFFEDCHDYHAVRQVNSDVAAIYYYDKGSQKLTGVETRTFMLRREYRQRYGIVPKEGTDGCQEIPNSRLRCFDYNWRRPPAPGAAM